MFLCFWGQYYTNSLAWIPEQSSAHLFSPRCVRTRGLVSLCNEVSDSNVVLSVVQLATDLDQIPLSYKLEQWALSSWSLDKAEGASRLFHPRITTQSQASTQPSRSVPRVYEEIPRCVYKASMCHSHPVWFSKVCVYESQSQQASAYVCQSVCAYAGVRQEAPWGPLSAAK